MAGTKPTSPNKTQQAKKQNKEHVYQPHWKSTSHAQVKLNPNYSCNLKNRQKNLKIENKNWQVWEERHKLGIWDEHMHTLRPVRFPVTPRPGPQAPPSRGLPRQEYWSGLPFSTPSYFRNPGIELTAPASPASAGATWEAQHVHYALYKITNKNLQYSTGKYTQDFVTA